MATRLIPPASRMAPLTPEELQADIRQSDLLARIRQGGGSRERAGDAGRPAQPRPEGRGWGCGADPIGSGSDRGRGREPGGNVDRCEDWDCCSCGPGNHHRPDRGSSAGAGSARGVDGEELKNYESDEVVEPHPEGAKRPRDPFGLRGIPRSLPSLGMTTEVVTSLPPSPPSAPSWQTGTPETPRSGS